MSQRMGTASRSVLSPAARLIGALPTSVAHTASPRARVRIRWAIAAPLLRSHPHLLRPPGPRSVAGAGRRAGGSERQRSDREAPDQEPEEQGGREAGADGRGGSEVE